MRAIRRHHYQRLKRKAKRYYFAGWLRDAPLNTDEQCGFIANTRTPCSRPCCGNPRRFKSWIDTEKVTDQDGRVSTQYKRRYTNKKNRITKQELMHTIEFELKAE